VAHATIKSITGVLQFVVGLVLVLRFRQGELCRPRGRAALHVRRILLKLDRRGTDIKDQDHTSPLQESREPILCNE
jgi:hypothetical protein